MALLLASSGSLWCDSALVTRQRLGSHETLTWRYQRGTNLRYETLQPDSRHGHVVIQRGRAQFLYNLDLQLRQYSEFSNQFDFLQILAGALYRRPAEKASGKNLDIYYEAVDTGERREEFGMTARHLKISQRFVPEQGACSWPYEILEDGWYAQTPGNSKPQKDHALSSFLITGSAGCHDRLVFHGSRPHPGIALHVARTEVHQGGVSSSSVTDVIAYSTAMLSDKLFDAPVGFTKVDRLSGEPSESWADRIQLDWSQLAGAVESWFN